MSTDNKINSNFYQVAVVDGNADVTGLTVADITATASADLGTVTAVTITGGLNGQVLTTDGSGNLSWATPAAGGVTSVDVSGGTTGLTTSGGPITSSGTITIAGTLTEANGGTNQTTYAGGDILYASAANTLAKRNVGSDGQVLTVSSGLPVWSSLPASVTTFNTSLDGLTPTVGTSGAVTLAGTLGAISGGTSQSTYATGDILYASGTNTLSKLGIGSTGTVLTVSGGVPSWAAASGGTSYTLQPVRVATTANGALATAYENGDTIDGVVLATGDRILLKNQTTATENGVYTVNASGAPTRTSDFTTGAATLVGGTIVPVTAGTVNGGMTYRCMNTAAITIGVTNITFGPINGITVAGSAAWATQPVSSGTTSVAIGPTATASNTDAIAIGNTSTGAGTQSVAIGASAVAGFPNSISIGNAVNNAVANPGSTGTIAIGSSMNIRSGGQNNIFIGASQNTNPTTGALRNIAIGNQTYHPITADTVDTIAIGTLSYALGNSGIAIGNTARAGQSGSAFPNNIAIGNSVTCSATSSPGASACIGIGNTISLNATEGIAIGQSITISSAGITNPIAIGRQASAGASYATAIGRQASAGTSESIAIGFQANANTQNRTIAIGASANAAGTSAVAIGTSSGAAGTESYSLGAFTATGARGVSIGYSATTTAGGAGIAIGHTTTAGAAGIALGTLATNDFSGQVNICNARFASAGDIMTGFVPMYMQTTTNATTELKTSAGTATTAPTGVIVCTNFSTYIFDVDIVARSVGSASVAAYNLKFAFNRNANAASSTISTLSKTILYTIGTVTGWDVTATADTTNGRPNISVTGAAATTINWVANVRMTKVATAS